MTDYFRYNMFDRSHIHSDMHSGFASVGQAQHHSIWNMHYKKDTFFIFIIFVKEQL